MYIGKTKRPCTVAYEISHKDWGGEWIYTDDLGATYKQFWIRTSGLRDVACKPNRTHHKGYYCRRYIEPVTFRNIT